MKTGDASAEIWLEGLRHVYCCEVTSERKTLTGRVRYFWRVEMATIDQKEHIYAPLTQTKFKPCRTFADALRLSRRLAEYLERTRAEIDRRRARR